MADLIDRQAAIDALIKCGDYYNGNDEAKRGVSQCIGVVYELPSAQPEIIRCKDCKHSEHWYRDKRRCFLWHETGIGVFEDGFCNYAERRTDE